jgi:hypothetical protein
MCPTTKRICRPPALKTLPHHSRAVRQSSQALAIGKQTRPLPSHDHADASIRYGRQSKPVSPAPVRTLKLAELTSRPQPASPRPDAAGSSEVTTTKQELTPEPQRRIWPIVAPRLGAQMARNRSMKGRPHRQCGPSPIPLARQKPANRFRTRHLLHVPSGAPQRLMNASGTAVGCRDGEKGTDHSLGLCARYRFERSHAVQLGWVRKSMQLPTPRKLRPPS